MLPETVDLYAKYRFFLYLLSNERLMLFHKNKNELDYENFFDLYNWVIHKHWQIKPLYKIFRTRRAAIIKKFNHGKYYILLSSHFCNDIVTVIISFIM